MGSDSTTREPELQAGNQTKSRVQTSTVHEPNKRFPTSDKQLPNQFLSISDKKFLQQASILVLLLG
jgi:hypothetical protein